MVLPGGRPGDRYPLLPRAPSAEGARAAPDARRRRRDARVVPASAAPRVRPRLRPRLPLLRTPPLAGALREPEHRIPAGALPPAPVQPQLRRPPRQLVRAVAPRRGLRRDLRGLAGDVGSRVARALRRLEGAGQAPLRRRARRGGARPTGAAAAG